MKEKASPQTKKKTFVSMQLINPNAAGIDIGDLMHVVAIPPDRDMQPVRTFGTMTSDLYSLADWLQECKIDTVALESTGVYWKPLFEILIARDIEVYLVHAKHVKNVTSRKTDQTDAQWLQQLHSCGLLKSCYLPSASQEALRTLVRYRRAMTQDSSRYVLRMQKSLEVMNIKLHTILSDIVGKTGIAILEAILEGERDANNFLHLIDKRVKASPDTIKESLNGNWKSEHLFILKESFDCYKFLQNRISYCEQEIQKQLLKMIEEIKNSDNSAVIDANLKVDYD